jgi:hypothetical protein
VLEDGKGQVGKTLAPEAYREVSGLTLGKVAGAGDSGMIAAESHDNRARVAAAAPLPVVFLGPTLPRKEAEALLPARFQPPAGRGDIYRALSQGHTTIVLIDGEFHGRPSVWQREIADALAEGAVVHGAASMGAIRAAELHSLGMIGHGRIFEWYRDSVIDADDEVALVYGPAERGYPAISEPLVNIRATLEAATPEVITREDRNRLIEFMKGMYYPERSFAALLERGPAAAWPAEQRGRLALFLRERRIDQKRDDAMTALTAVGGGRIGHGAFRNGGQKDRWWRRDRLVLEGLLADRRADPAEIGRRAGLTEPEVTALHHELSALFFVALWGRAHGIVPAGADFDCLRARFPSAAGIPAPRLKELLDTRAFAEAAVHTFLAKSGTESAPRAIVREWAHENGIEHGGLQGDALVDWVIERGPNRFGYIWSFDVEITETLWLLGRVSPPALEMA